MLTKGPCLVPPSLAQAKKVMKTVGEINSVTENKNKGAVYV